MEYLGSGKSCIVHRGIDLEKNKSVVIKIMLPERVERGVFFKEMQMLKIMESHPGTPNIEGIYINSTSKNISLVYSFFSTTTLKEVFWQLSEEDVRTYACQLFEIVNYTHSQGIMHRDIKHINIIVDHPSKRLQLIDWGAAEFFSLNKSYTIHVGTKAFKPTELLIQNQCYDYTLDSYTSGIVFGSMVIKIIEKDNGV